MTTSRLRDGVRSLVPGRVRLRSELLLGLGDTEALQLMQALLDAPGVTGCTVNPRTGSLLLSWKPTALSEEQVFSLLTSVEALLVQWHAAVTEQGKPGTATRCAQEAVQAGLRYLSRWIAPEAARTRPKFAARVTQNRLMLGALGVSVAGLVVRPMAWHVQGGLLFLGLLAVHLWQHRRVL